MIITTWSQNRPGLSVEWIWNRSSTVRLWLPPDLNPTWGWAASSTCSHTWAGLTWDVVSSSVIRGLGSMVPPPPAASSSSTPSSYIKEFSLPSDFWGSLSYKTCSFFCFQREREIKAPTRTLRVLLIKIHCKVVGDLGGERKPVWSPL